MRVGGSPGAVYGGTWALWAGLVRIQPHRTACSKARWRMTCVRLTVPGASGLPLWPPRLRSSR